MLEVAARLFAERGFAGTNLQDIADELGISRPALYYYFKSKEEILESLVQEVTVFSQEQSTRLAATSDANPGETLRLMTRNHARWLLDHALAFRVVDRSESELTAATSKVHDTAKRTLLENFAAVVARGIEIGHFRPVDPYVTAFAIFGMCSWTAWWFKPDGRLPAAAIADAIGEFAVRGVQRPDARRSKKLEVADALETVREDLSHLELLLKR